MPTPEKAFANRELDDAELVRRINAGDERGFDQLVERYGGRMLQVARRITGNEADARDCLQNALFKCFENVDQFEGRAGLGTWLHRVTVNEALMRLRSRKRSREDSLDALLPEFDKHGARVDEGPIADTQEIEELYEQGQTRDAVRAAIDRLPDQYRAIVIARDIEQMSTAETAKVLGISISLAKTRLHRARAALKRLLDPVVDAGQVRNALRRT